MGNEIDNVEYQAIWENLTTGNSESHSGYIWNTSGGSASEFVQSADGTGPTYVLPQPDGQFHTYGVHWTPGSIVFYIDGKVVYSRASSSQVSIVPEYLMLNCALTTQNWLGTNLTLPQITAALPGYMQIDYVRSWSEGP